MKPLFTAGRVLLAMRVLLALFVVDQAKATDWPQFLGPNGNLTSADQILTKWPAAGLAQRWSLPLAGNSSFAVSRGRAYTLVRTNLDAVHRQELCLALDSTTGQTLWSTVVGDCSDALTDSNSTPTVSSNRVFVLSNDLRLSALDAQSGATLWSQNLIDQFGAQPIVYGSAASPLIDNDLVLVNSNSSADEQLIAFRVTDGQLVWRSAAGPAEHATPVLAVVQGVRQAIFFSENGLVSVAPDTGAVLWRYDTPSQPKPSPVIVGDVVFYCDTTGVGALRISASAGGLSVQSLWTSANLGRYLGSYYTTPVAQNGYIYGLFGSELDCLEPNTGTIQWSVTGAPFGSGGLISLPGYLLILGQDGELTLAEANPTVYKQIANFRPLSTGTCFGHPVVADGAIFLRSSVQAVCLNAVELVTQALKLSPPTRQTDGSFRVSASYLDGSRIPADLTAKLVWLSTTDLSTPLANWDRITDWTATNGVLQLGDGLPFAPQRFFMAVEPP
jgi:outer membrane protein assembly factor BamB